MNLPIPNSEEYLSRKPFPHLVIDNVFYEHQLNSILRYWPNFKNNSGRIRSTDENEFGEYISDFVKINFHSQKFIGFLEQLTGIRGLVLDCREIGLHETFPGGHLSYHLDYTINERTKLQHRVNAILYLNENWKAEYKGYLDLNGEIEIAPIFNRIVIFNIDNAWHGHPKKLKCPEGMSRKSIALNYFTAPVKDVVYIPTTYKQSGMRKFIPPIFHKFL